MQAIPIGQRNVIVESDDQLEKETDRAIAEFGGDDAETKEGQCGPWPPDL